MSGGVRGYVALGTEVGPEDAIERAILGEPMPGALTTVRGGLLFTPDGDQHVLRVTLEDRVYRGLYMGFWREDWTWMLWTPLWRDLGCRPYVAFGGDTLSVNLDATEGGRTWSLF